MGTISDGASSPDSVASRRVILFHSSDHAFWAEELAQEQGIQVDVGPAPAGGDSKCGLALTVDAPHLDQLLGALTREGVEFQLP